MDEIRAYKVKQAVESVSVKEKITANDNGKYTIVLLDFGYKENIVRELAKRDCRVIVLPYDSTTEKYLQRIGRHNAVQRTGDPADNPGIINNLKQLINRRFPFSAYASGTSYWHCPRF